MERTAAEELKPAIDTKTHEGLYKDAASGFQALLEAFNYWSGLLNNRSVQMLLSLIAANWAVHGSNPGILANDFSRASLIVIFMALGIDLVLAFAMTQMHLKRFEYAERDRPRWSKEFEETAGTLSPWPFTAGISTLGQWIAWVRMLAPILAGILFVLSLF